MLTTSDFKKGLAIQVEGVPYVIMEYSVQTPSARGSATLVRIKGRNGRIQQERTYPRRSPKRTPG